MSPAGSRLTRDDWIQAGYTMVAELGVAALRVEPLARRLKATKGSFYWHFTDRADLLHAVLAGWRERATDAVIADVELAPATERIETLLTGAVGHTFFPDGVEWAILCAADQDEVRPFVTEVHRRRLDYLISLFAAAGQPTEQARARAHISYATYLGNLQLAQFLRDVPADQRSAQAVYIAELVKMIRST